MDEIRVKNTRYAPRTVTRRTVSAGLLAGLLKLNGSEPPVPWVVYYSDKESVAAFERYRILILDSRYHPPLIELANRGKRLIGYLSVGEVSPDYTYFAALEQEGLLAAPRPAWPGNRIVDLRDERWCARLCDSIIPAILQSGFHGLFLDTLDSALHLETVYSSEFSGMSDAAVNLIRKIRERFPRATLAINRAYSLLERLASDLDIAVGESVFSTYDFARKVYCLVNSEAYEMQVKWLRAAVQRNRKLGAFTLDYWNATDTGGVQAIYRVQRENGFSPYVATIDLTTLVSESGR